jgi:hypothetical protein
MMKKAGVAVLVTAIIGLLVFTLSKNTPRSQPAPTADSGSAETPSLPKPPVPVPSASASAVPITANDRKLLGELNQILASKNDNDPRLDTDFRHLSPGTKQLLLGRYQELPVESRNERGTIVFLIGRDLNRPEDCQFLADVTSEQPCLNLADCKKPPSHTDEDVHEEAAISITLAYPQHVAVKSMQNFLGNPDQDPALVRACLSSLERMTESPVGPIAREATTLRADIQRNGN